MSDRKLISVRRRFTPEERARFDAAREQVERDLPQRRRDARAKKAELLALHDAMRALKREREARGLSLADVAERSGIDKSRLSKLENDLNSNPTLATLNRVADAIGVRIEIHVASA